MIQGSLVHWLVSGAIHRVYWNAVFRHFSHGKLSRIKGFKNSIGPTVKVGKQISISKWFRADNKYLPYGRFGLSISTTCLRESHITKSACEHCTNQDGEYKLGTLHWLLDCFYLPFDWFNSAKSCQSDDRQPTSNHHESGSVWNVI